MKKCGHEIILTYKDFRLFRFLAMTRNEHSMTSLVLIHSINKGRLLAHEDRQQMAGLISQQLTLKNYSGKCLVCGNIT